MTSISDFERTPTVAKVSVAVKADALDPAEVTRVVDLLPTRAYRKGEISPNRSVPRPRGIWAIECRADNIETATAELLAIVETRMGQLREAASKYDGAELTVGIFWQPEGGQGGYSLSSDVVQRLSKLGTRIDFYFC